MARPVTGRRATSCTVCALCVRLSPILAHGIAAHLDAVGVVHQAIRMEPVKETPLRNDYDRRSIERSHQLL